MQRNWIGRSEGVEFDLPFAADPAQGAFGSSRPDRTPASASPTPCVAPEHPLLDELTTDDERDDVDELVERRPKQSELERTASSEPAPPREARRLHRQLRDQPLQRRVGAGLRRRLRARHLRHRRHHGRARRGRTRLRLRHRAYGLPVVRTTQPPDGFEGGAYTGDGAHDQLAVPGRTRRRRGQGRRDEFLAEHANGEPQGQLPTSRLADLAPALLGLSDPRRLLRRPAGSSRCRRTSCRSCCPTTSR